MTFIEGNQDPSYKIWESINWAPSKEQLAQFIQLQKLLKHWNNQVNLTRLINSNDYWINQIYDSLWPLKEELRNPHNNFEAIDVGTGCGFPGLAVAIAFPNSNITLLDAINKKTHALKEIVKEIGIDSRVTIRTERVEVTGHNPALRGTFNIAMARAVNIAPVVAEYLVPFLSPKGEAFLYKGQWTLKNHEDLLCALGPLKAEIKSLERIDLPNDRGIRHVIRLTPKDNCPKVYPRKIGVPSKKPLGN